MHIAIYSYFLILSWNFLCADMFPYEDFQNRVCLSVPREKKFTLDSSMSLLQ